jgi:hypothetical protein
VAPADLRTVDAARVKQRRDRARLSQINARAYGPEQLVPRDWIAQTPEPNWHGKRFVSPDGNAWFAAYSAPADRDRLADHFKAVAFAEGEQINLIRGERNWLFVAGTKADRAFYRKARLACAGNTWHHIAFEFPIDMQGEMARIVANAVTAIDQSDADGCERTAVSSVP